MVRAGKFGERESDALTTGLVIAGWPEMGDLSGYSTRQELHAAVRAAYPTYSRTVVANWTGQLWRLLRVMQVDDLVVIPLKTSPAHIAVGVIVGEYRYRSESNDAWRHVRPVKWLQIEQPRAALKQDLLYTLGSLLTICQLRRNGAARRIAEIAQTGIDPGPTADEIPNDGLVTPGAFLERAAASDDGIALTVRDLLTMWGASRRTTPAVSRIANDLAENALTTEPPFTDGWIDSIIRIVRSGADADSSMDATSVALSHTDDETEPDVETADEPTGAELINDRPFTLRFGNLLRQEASLVAVRPTDPIVLAQTLMLHHNYSQLAVLDEHGAMHGAISWETIAQAPMSTSTPTLVNQATRPAAQAEYDDRVIPRIEDISSKGFIFVRSKNHKTIAGIVTASDLTQRFGEIAKPFSMIEDCERRLQRRVKERISPEIIKSETKKRYHDADSLTFGAYPYVLERREIFILLGWPLDHKQFVDQIREVAAIRNKMMHFSPDPIPNSEWGAIDGLLAMLYAVDPRP
jgi:Uncharacterized conserved protein